jgi:uncharacterized protein (DUF2141 family)
MFKFVQYTLFVALFLLLQNSSLAQGTLTIQVENISEPKGKIMVAIYNQAAGFREAEKAFKRLLQDATGTAINITVGSLPAGEYAIAVFHDANSNQLLDTGTFGIPKESYGFSNNPKIKVTPPHFDSCKFSHNDQNKTVKIVLNN